MRTALLAVAAAMLLTVTPIANAQGTQNYEGDGTSGYDDGPVQVTLYHHVFNLLDRVPMNTQQMDSAAPDLAQGRTGPTLGTPAGDAPVSNANYLYMFNSPGPVHYNTSLNEPRFHPERGLAEDLQLDSEEMEVYWYMSADALETVSEGPVSTGVIPQVTVEATVRLGDDIGGNLDDGQVVAEGSTTVDIMTPPDGGVTEIRIPLGSPQLNSIPKDESFNLKVEWFQADQGGFEYMDRQWNLHTGTDYPNRLLMTIENPIRLNYVHPQPIGERKIAIHTAFVTPFGNYDVDLQKLSLDVEGPDGNTVIQFDNGTLQQGEEVRGPIIVQKSFQHNHHFEPVLVTWTWNYKEAGAAPGDYQVNVNAANLQGSAVAEKTASFTIEEEGQAKGFSDSGQEVAPASAEDDGDTNDSPLGLGPLAAALLAALALVAVRRRNR